MPPRCSRVWFKPDARTHIPGPSQDPSSLSCTQEVIGEGRGMRALREGYLPGDLGFDPLGLKPKGEADLLAMQNKELNNGRLAMLAIAGMTAQELVTGQQNF